MCCRHGNRGNCVMWNTRTWSSFACGACFHMRWPGVSSDTCCTWRNKPRRGCCRWRLGNIWGGVVPWPANEGGRTAGTWLRGDGLLGGTHQQAAAEFIYEHVEGAKAVAGIGVGSIGIHDNVGVVRG